MKQTIWKAELPVHALNGDSSCEISLPAPFDVLSVQEQYGKLVLWAIVRPDDPPIKRRFKVFGTGKTLPDDLAGYGHVGTAVMGNGALVLHVFNA